MRTLPPLSFRNRSRKQTGPQVRCHRSPVPENLQRRKGTQGTAADFKQPGEKRSHAHRHRPNHREAKAVSRAERWAQASPLKDINEGRNKG